MEIEEKEGQKDVATPVVESGGDRETEVPAVGNNSTEKVEAGLVLENGEVGVKPIEVAGDRLVKDSLVKEPVKTTEDLIKEELNVSEDAEVDPVVEGKKEPVEEKAKIPVITKSVLDNKNIIQELLVKARKAIQQRRQRRLDKIILALSERGKLTNREIRKITRKSRTTVKEYMDILEDQGKVVQVGKSGRGVYYKLK